MKAHSAEEHESAIMKCLSQTRIVTNLLRLQNTTFQTCSFSKYSPIIPRLIFKASLFSLSPPTTNPRTLSTRERGRERERATAEMRGAFKSGVPWVVGSVSGNLSHPVYGRQISARDRRELAGASAWTQLLSLFSICSRPPSLRSQSACKPFHTASLSSTPSNLKQTRQLCPRCPRPQENDRGGIKLLIKRILFMQQAHSNPHFILISKYGFNRAELPYLQCSSQTESSRAWRAEVWKQNPDTGVM